MGNNCCGSTTESKEPAYILGSGTRRAEARPKHNNMNWSKAAEQIIERPIESDSKPILCDI